MEKFREFIRQNSMLVGVFSLIQLILIILIVVTVQRLNDRTVVLPSVSVPNIAEAVEGLPKSAESTIEEALFNAISLNYTSAINENNHDIKVREDSVIHQYFERQNIHYFNFVIDVPDIKQSYQVYYEHSDDINNKYILANSSLFVMCPSKDKIIYEDFDCKDRFDQNGESLVVSIFIKYFNFEEFSAYVDTKDIHKIVISPLNFKANKTTQNSYISKVKEAISSLGFSPDKFTYYVFKESDLNFNTNT